MMNAIMLSVIMLSVNMLSVIMLSVNMLSVIMLSVVVPSNHHYQQQYILNLTVHFRIAFHSSHPTVWLDGVSCFPPSFP
jgi:hypothetical protein